MKFENTEVTGFENAIWGARLPMCKNLEEAKGKSDRFIFRHIWFKNISCKQ